MNYKRNISERAMKRNLDIKEYAEHAGVKLWEVAERLHMADTTFSRELRHELPQNDKDYIFRIIDEIKGGNK